MINKIFFHKKKYILNIYFTAGYPTLSSTKKVIQILQKNNIDIIEVGIPYSDALADGIIIQNSSNKSLINGMNIDKLFAQLQCLKKELHIPIIFMGYYNSFFKFGEGIFLKKCKHAGISGVLYPDIPAYIYKLKYQKLFQENNLYYVLILTTQTSIERLFKLKALSKGFVYLVSSTSTTGKQFYFDNKKDEFFIFLKKKKILHVPKLIGFGISDKKSFHWSCLQSEGAIIGSAFIKKINNYEIGEAIQLFLQNIKGNR